MATDPAVPFPGTLSLLAALLAQFMNLSQERVIVYNQDWPIPTDDGIQIVVSFVAQRVHANNAVQRISDDGTELLEDITTNVSMVAGIDIYSANQDALNRKEEVIQAFTSTPAQQMAEQYGIRWPQITTGFVNVSMVEGTQQMNRFHLDLAILRSHKKTSAIEYFDKFQEGPALIVNQ